MIEPAPMMPSEGAPQGVHVTSNPEPACGGAPLESIEEPERERQIGDCVICGETALIDGGGTCGCAQ